MAAYAILYTVEVRDEDLHAEFRSLVPALLEAKGDKFVSCGDVLGVTGDGAGQRRLAVMEFPTADQAHEWVGPQTEPKYVELRELRERAGRCISYVVEADKESRP